MVRLGLSRSGGQVSYVVGQAAGTQLFIGSIAAGCRSKQARMARLRPARLAAWRPGLASLSSEVVSELFSRMTTRSSVMRTCSLHHHVLRLPNPPLLHSPYCHPRRLNAAADTVMHILCAVGDSQAKCANTRLSSPNDRSSMIQYDTYL